MTVNQSKENLNGCREQMKPGEEGIDGILEILKVYVCDELCCHRGAVTQELEKLKDLRTLHGVLQQRQQIKLKLTS